MTESSREKSKREVIAVLNQARGMELHAISQYMNQHYTLDNMDYGELAKNVKLIAIDEMRHAEMFAERIKELAGEPTSDPAAGSVSSIVPVHSPENSFLRKSFFCWSVPKCWMSSPAPCVSPAYITKAKFAAMR